MLGVFRVIQPGILIQPGTRDRGRGNTIDSVILNVAKELLLSEAKKPHVILSKEKELSLSEASQLLLF
jgi:hypothetical protein